MKISKLIAGFGLMLLGSVSINASAQSSACTWNSVYGYTSGNYSYTSFICRQSSGNVIASRQDVYNLSWGTYTCGSVSVASGYQNTGITQGSSYPFSCNTNIVVANTPASSSAASSSVATNVCYTGYSQIIQTSPTPYPTFNPAVCGPQPQCKYSVTPLDQHSYPRLKYTCL